MTAARRHAGCERPPHGSECSLKRTTSTLLAGALTAGTTAVLTVAAPGLASATSCDPTVVTDRDLQGWEFTSDTRAAGTVTFQRPSGLAVEVTEQSSAGKAAGYYALGDGIPLADVSAQSNYSITTDQGEDVFVRGFSYQLKIDRDADGVFAHGVGGDQYLVYEPAFYGTGNWHTSTGGSQQGYEFTGDLDDYLALHPQAEVAAFGFSLGSGVPAAETLVTAFRFGCNTFTFAKSNDAPSPAFTYDDAGDTDNYTFDFDASSTVDPDGDTLTYRWLFDDGSGEAFGAQVSHTFPGPGSYYVQLAVDDGNGHFVTTAQTVTVTRQPDTVKDTPLPNTGADVMGLALIGGAVLAAGGAGVVMTRRRKADVEA